MGVTESQTQEVVAGSNTFDEILYAVLNVVSRNIESYDKTKALTSKLERCFKTATSYRGFQMQKY